MRTHAQWAGAKRRVDADDVQRAVSSVIALRSEPPPLVPLSAARVHAPTLKRSPKGETYRYADMIYPIYLIVARKTLSSHQ